MARVQSRKSTWFPHTPNADLRFVQITLTNGRDNAIRLFDSFNVGSQILFKLSSKVLSPSTTLVQLIFIRVKWISLSMRSARKGKSHVLRPLAERFSTLSVNSQCNSLSSSVVLSGQEVSISLSPPLTSSP